MLNISSGSDVDYKFSNLKTVSSTEVEDLLLDNEKMIYAFEGSRCQVVFTNNRILTVDKEHGRILKRRTYFSYSYSKIQYYGLEITDYLDYSNHSDATVRSSNELLITFINGYILKFDFKSEEDARMIHLLISKYVL